MAVYYSVFHMVMLQQCVEVAQALPGVYCRTNLRNYPFKN